MSVTIRPAVASDFEALLDAPLPFRVRALTGEKDGKILGIGGLAYLPNGEFGMFLALGSGGEKYPIALHKTALRLLAEAEARGVRKIVSLADTSFLNAVRWHERLGFRPVEVGGQKVFTWTPSR